jgi:hypothetical protein
LHCFSDLIHDTSFSKKVVANPMALLLWVWPIQLVADFFWTLLQYSILNKKFFENLGTQDHVFSEPRRLEKWKNVVTNNMTANAFMANITVRRLPPSSPLKRICLQDTTQTGACFISSGSSGSRKLQQHPFHALRVFCQLWQI